MSARWSEACDSHYTGRVVAAIARAVQRLRLADTAQRGAAALHVRPRGRL